jgi:hypothetical protein
MILVCINDNYEIHDQTIITNTTVLPTFTTTLRLSYNARLYAGGNSSTPFTRSGPT